jgi:transposase-like protein
MTKRGKKAWTKWRRLVSEHARSGQTVTAFCRERSLCRPYFFAWKKKLQESAATKFLEVQVTERAPSTFSDGSVEIRLQNGRSLMVRPGFDAEHVRALLALAEAAR